MVTKKQKRNFSQHKFSQNKFNLGQVATTRDKLLLQTQQLAQRRSEKPPKLPPRDNQYPHDIPKVSVVVILIVTCVSCTTLNIIKFQ